MVQKKMLEDKNFSFGVESQNLGLDHGLEKKSWSWSLGVNVASLPFHFKALINELTDTQLRNIFLNQVNF